MSPTVAKSFTGAVLLAVAAWMLATSPAVQAQSQIPRPPGIQDDVNFWIRVYTEVTTNEGLLHDERNLAVV